jgi:hypothetical protein
MAGRADMLRHTFPREKFGQHSLFPLSAPNAGQSTVYLKTTFSKADDVIVKSYAMPTLEIRIAQQENATRPSDSSGYQAIGPPAETSTKGEWSSGMIFP